jgi:hypothetical protein
MTFLARSSSPSDAALTHTELPLSAKCRCSRLPSDNRLLEIFASRRNQVVRRFRLERAASVGGTR